MVTTCAGAALLAAWGSWSAACALHGLHSPATPACFRPDLATIGGLSTLLALLGSSHASLRWRAAEVCATCVQNNPPVQRSFMDGGIIPRLLPLLCDDDAKVRVKGLLALR